MFRTGDIPMVFVSGILGRPVVDEARHRVGRVDDIVASSGELYPVITGFVVRSGRTRRFAPASAFRLKDIGPRDPLVVDPAAIRELKPERHEFLVRDLLLDQQIVDVQGAKVERVNDVQLLVADRLWIVHVDVGFTGLMRRLGFETPVRALWRLAGRRLQDELISWKFVQPLAESEEPGQPLRLRVEHARIHELHPGELADILADLGKDERQMIVHSLGPEAAADALEEAEEDVQAAVFAQLDPEMAADILEEMDPGEAADILGSLPEAQSEEIIAEVEREDREVIEQLIAYEEKTAAALMTPEFIAVSPGTTVTEALEEVRRQASEIEGIYYVYVLDADHRLIGVTTLRTLFRSLPGQPVKEIMETRLVKVEPGVEPGDVAEIFQKYSLLGCPVVDGEGRMLGVILMKHAFDELLPHFKREGRP
jgi:magnesium transporter